MDSKREAPESENGFFYQRYYCINYILSNINFEYILEEGYEDIDLIKINNNREIIQVKYYGDENESLTINSGLYKVIIANYNKQNIDKIKYLAYNKNNEIYKKDLLNIFKLKKYFNIGKFLLLIIYKNIKKDINFTIKNIEKIDDIMPIKLRDHLPKDFSFD